MRSKCRAGEQRLALFLPSLRGGGAERTMVTLARGFVERGLAVDLVLAKAEGPYLSHVVAGVRVIDLGASRVLFGLPGLVRYLRKERPQALLSAMDHANVVALCARRMARVNTRVVVSVRSTIGMASANAPSLKGRMMPFWVRRFYPLADAVVAVSAGVAADLVRIAGVSENRVQVIYSPVVTPELLAKAEEPLGHPWFENGTPPVVLGVGRLTKAKDFPTLMRAFAQVRRERPARLMILGEGEERPGLEALARALGVEADVALPGFVDNPYKYMRRAAVYVLSSRWEGLPGVLIEAMACGAQVVSTDCPSGPAEILKQGELGCLVPVGSPVALAGAIKGRLNTCGAAEKHDGKRYVEQAFSYRSSVEQYLNLLLQEVKMV